MHWNWSCQHVTYSRKVQYTRITKQYQYHNGKPQTNQDRETQQRKWNDVLLNNKMLNYFDREPIDPHVCKSKDRV